MIISSARLSFYKKEIGKPISYAMHSYCENANLVEKMFQYHELIGVDGYDQYEHRIMWFLNKEWFTSKQIERMLALRAFS